MPNLYQNRNIFPWQISPVLLGVAELGEHLCDPDLVHVQARAGVGCKDGEGLAGKLRCKDLGLRDEDWGLGVEVRAESARVLQGRQDGAKTRGSGPRAWSSRIFR